MAQKGTIHSFFTPDPKKQRTTTTNQDETPTYSTHNTYPFPIRDLSPSITKELASLPARPGKPINDQPELDLVYFEPFIPSYLAKDLFRFLRSELPFYRVEYTVKRFGVETQIRTPRYTTVFGLDHTSLFDDDDPNIILDAKTRTWINTAEAYPRYSPRPIPQCLDALRKSTEAAAGCRFNFCLVNYYASGSDSISFHSDDERFLGPEPAIASFSLGAARDFLMKHKPAPPPPDGQTGPVFKQLKLPLASGDMILMKDKTQANWLHSIPKRAGKSTRYAGGRINITFRRAMVKGGTDNYYNYNVGNGPVFRWDDTAQEMKEWKPPSKDNPGPTVNTNLKPEQKEPDKTG
ncbi:putative alpha-ketoglutarate-dependent dioxygenase [Triangularia verruculosa]|uniref:Alpha-ketoglutarate-dependent dioxygenase n=1 Tax=Triangularia verruculosa TaxID=2587418 RepID=A0AAN7AQW9_9PEZI|nr:putative alpha-ketoglutarate-dependent dioxygenase [Triangularia verruculosa]